jgi:LPXTG-site transpeptidase (sortase) family protein
MKIVIRRTPLIITLVGCALSIAFIVHILFKRPSVSSPPTANGAVLAEREQRKFGLPVRLKIPKINVDATVEYVGLTPDGAMDVPKDPADAAWFKLGPRPGENGSAVIAGHYGLWKNGERSVFDDVHTLRKGDKLSVEDEQGVTTMFVVREHRRVDPSADASDVFGSQDGKAHLNLITCEGVWNETQKSYSRRLIVFTDKEEGK